MAQFTLIDTGLTDGVAPPGSAIPTTQATQWLAHLASGRFRDAYVAENAGDNAEYSALTFAAAATTSLQYDVLFAYRVAASGNVGAVATNFSGTDSANIKAALFQVDATNAYLSRFRGSGFSPSYLLMGTHALAGGSAVSAGTLVWVRGHVSASGSVGTYSLSAWLTDPFGEPGTWQLQTTADPHNMASGGVGLFEFTGTGRLQFEYLSVGTDGDAAPLPVFPPDAPAVAVSDIRRTSVLVTPAAYSHPLDTPQADREARVRRVSNDAIEVAAVSMPLDGPFYLTGLPEGPSGDGGRPAVDPDLVVEVRDKDALGDRSEWGISAPFQTLNLWESREFVTVADLLIERPEGDGTVMQSYADFGGINWLKTWRISPASVDTPIGSASFTLHRQVGGVSLAPLVTGSALNLNGATFAPALDFGREVEFRAVNLRVDSRVTLAAEASYGDESLTVAALDSDIGAGSTLHFAFARATVTTETAAGALSLPITPLTNDVADGSVAKVSRQPTAAEWLAGYHWRGLTDDIEWPRKSGDITVPCRDYAGRLQDTMMRTEARYGDPDTPPDAFAVMQAYVDAHMGVGQYVLVDLTTGARLAITEWIPKDVKVWEGLQQIALQWGGKSLRQVDTATESYIAVIEPDRTADTAEYGVGPGTYLEVHRLTTSGANLRTIVRGRCVDKATGKILVSQIPAEEDVDTDPLVDLYGPFFLQFDEDQASAIDTQAKLGAMVAAAYADVSTPPFPVEVETKFAPFAAVDGMVEWGENALLWDEPLVAATLALTHSGDAPGAARTRWQSSDRPKGHWQEWVRRGVDVAGIGKRPSIFGLTLTHDPVGTLNVEIDYNEQVEFWRAWDKVGASPVVADVPDSEYAQGEYPKPQRTASWNVQNGVHYVAVRAYAGDRWVPAEDSIAIVGVGPGSGEVPTTRPLTPFLERGAVDGGNQAVVATWGNTNTADALELEYFIDGVTDPGGLVSLPAATSTDEREYLIGSRISMHARYTAGTGLEGPWSPLSNVVFLPGSLP